MLRTRGKYELDGSGPRPRFPWLEQRTVGRVSDLRCSPNERRCCANRGFQLQAVARRANFITHLVDEIMERRPNTAGWYLKIWDRSASRGHRANENERAPVPAILSRRSRENGIVQPPLRLHRPDRIPSIFSSVPPRWETIFHTRRAKITALRVGILTRYQPCKAATDKATSLQVGL